MCIAGIFSDNNTSVEHCGNDTKLFSIRPLSICPPNHIKRGVLDSRVRHEPLAPSMLPCLPIDEPVSDRRAICDNIPNPLLAESPPHLHARVCQERNLDEVLVLAPGNCTYGHAVPYAISHAKDEAKPFSPTRSVWKTVLQMSGVAFLRIHILQSQAQAPEPRVHSNGMPLRGSISSDKSTFSRSRTSVHSFIHSFAWPFLHSAVRKPPSLLH